MLKRVFLIYLIVADYEPSMILDQDSNHLPQREISVSKVYTLKTLWPSGCLQDLNFVPDYLGSSG